MLLVDNAINLTQRTQIHTPNNNNCPINVALITCT